MQGIGRWLREWVARGRMVARIAGRVLGLLGLGGVGWVGICEGKEAVLWWILLL